MVGDVLDLEHVFAGQDGKANIAEDLHVILVVKMVVIVIYPIDVAVHLSTGDHFVNFHPVTLHVDMAVCAPQQTIAHVVNIIQENIVEDEKDEVATLLPRIPKHSRLNYVMRSMKIWHSLRSK
ncbi:Hypothetical predicted protein [Mytilus galloprovincialis]|uniref:Uncharacterized protein n=1 Tax=Mytilus galloprovincialis TaxID=29158 RepID=A0A8B6DFW9_MYTGA|nr:Hypothetical predicted protein [Mytilus galloprovincialis]